MKILKAAALLVVTGCTSYSGVMAIQDGTYVLTASGAFSRSDVRGSAGEKADKFCGERQQRANLIEASDGTRFMGPTQTTITFRCVAGATAQVGK